MGRPKKKIKKQYIKSKKMIAKIPREILDKIRNEVMPKYGMKSLQEIFDYIIVSGIVYLDSAVVKYVDERIGPYRERFKEIQLARLKREKVEMPDYHKTNFMMFPSEYDMFCKFLVEKNYKQQWVYEIIFHGFAEEEPILIKLITKGQRNNVRERKKTVARIANDEWVVALPGDEAAQILEQLTEKYENRKFDQSIQGDIDRFIIEAKAKLEEDEEIDLEINRKAREAKNARAALARTVTQPVNVDAD